MFQGERIPIRVKPNGSHSQRCAKMKSFASIINQRKDTLRFKQTYEMLRTQMNKDAELKKVED